VAPPDGRQIAGINRPSRTRRQPSNGANRTLTVEAGTRARGHRAIRTRLGPAAPHPMGRAAVSTRLFAGSSGGRGSTIRTFASRGCDRGGVAPRRDSHTRRSARHPSRRVAAPWRARPHRVRPAIKLRTPDSARSRRRRSGAPRVNGDRRRRSSGVLGRNSSKSLVAPFVESPWGRHKGRSRLRATVPSPLPHRIDSRWFAG
jgi:hypothetical protein